MERERTRQAEARIAFDSHYDRMMLEQAAVVEADKKFWEKPVIKAAETELQYSATRGARVAMMTGMFAEIKSKPIDGRVTEILPGSHTSTHRHSYETMMFITEGMGYSIVGGKRYKWAERDCLYIPPDVWHQHWNRDPDKPARYLNITNAPIIQDTRMMQVEDIGNAPEHPGEVPVETFYEQELSESQKVLRDRADNPILRVWKEVNLKLNQRGAKSSWMINSEFYKTGGIDMAVNMLPPGGFMQSHRHGGGALLYIVEGKGYTMIDDVKHEWEKGDLVYISHWCWHQHFNRDLKKVVVYIRMVDHKWATRYLTVPLPYREHRPDGPDPLGIVWPEDEEHGHDHDHPGHQD